jgi:hypothetical protein
MTAPTDRLGQTVTADPRHICLDLADGFSDIPLFGSMGVSPMSSTGVSLGALTGPPVGLFGIASEQHGRDGRATHGQVLGTPNGDARAAAKTA